MDTNLRPSKSWLAVGFLLIVGLSALTANVSDVQAAGPTVAHVYELNGSFADELGGPALVPARGTLDPTNYSFGPNQGLALSNGLADAGSYSIETVFRFSEINGYRKIIDFKDRTVDAGLYNRTGELRFHSIQSGPSGAFAPNVVAHLVVAKDATTDGFVAYVNGIRQIAFMDTGDNAVFSAPNNIIHFFKDDSGSEASAGVVDRIVVYDGALTAAEAADLFAPPVPRPLSISMTLTEATLTPWAGPRWSRREEHSVPCTTPSGRIRD